MGGTLMNNLTLIVCISLFMMSMAIQCYHFKTMHTQWHATSTLLQPIYTTLNTLTEQMTALQRVFDNKQTRGHWGEMQLYAILCDHLPAQYVCYQADLPNGQRVDCLITLPSGQLSIDSKFPLENLRALANPDNTPSECLAHQQQFRAAFKQHVQAVAAYIQPGTTKHEAILFIPSEAIFAIIHMDYPEVVTYAHQRRVWLASPNTLMALILTIEGLLQDGLQQAPALASLLTPIIETGTQTLTRLQKHMTNLQHQYHHFTILWQRMHHIIKTGHTSDHSDRL
jgi:DNA anti-recombination protein RmuC